MPRTKELAEDRRARIVGMHKAERVTKASLKPWCPCVHGTERSVWWRIRACQLDWLKSLAHANITVEKSTSSKTLNSNGNHGRTPRKPLLSKKKKTLLHVSRLQKSSLKLNMVEGATSFGTDLLPRGVYQDILQENLRPSANWSSTDDGWCNGTTTQSIEVTKWLQWKKIHLLESCPARVLMSTNCDAVSWPQESGSHQTSQKRLNWNSFVQRNGPKFLDRCAGLICIYRNVWLRRLLPKEGQPPCTVNVHLKTNENLSFFEQQTVFV